MNKQIEGVTTLANLAPKTSRSLKPEQVKDMKRAIDVSKARNLTSVLMWTGKYMEGTDDTDLALYDKIAEKEGRDPNHKRKKYLIPVMKDVPFESHFNNGGDLMKYFDRGYMFEEEMPEEAKKYLEIARARTMYGNTDGSAELTPEAFKREHGDSGKAPEQLAEVAICNGKTGSGDDCGAKALAGTTRCRHHQEEVPAQEEIVDEDKDTEISKS